MQILLDQLTTCWHVGGMIGPVEVKKVIITTLTTRGKGVHPDPVRAITQIWEMDGSLIAEIDPCGQSEIERKYNELISEVKTKHPNEDRHATALRYIQQRELPSLSEAAQQMRQPKF